MTNYNSVWVTGTPRTGSMWTTNIVREIFITRAFIVYPDIQKQHDKQWFNLYHNKAAKDLDTKNKYVLKTHAMLRPPGIPGSRFIVNIRNPFDICASFREFMKCDAKRAIGLAKHHLEVIKHYRSFSENEIFFLRYEEIENKPIESVLNVSKFLDAEINQDAALKISEKFNKANVKSLVKNTDKILEEKIKNKQKISESEIVRFKNHFRAFNLHTGFQTRHVSNRESGEWRKAFLSNEIPAVLDALNPISEKLGYSPETL